MRGFLSTTQYRPTGAISDDRYVEPAGTTGAGAAAEWLVDRLSRLAPSLQVESRIEPGGGQYLVVLTW